MAQKQFIGWKERDANVCVQQRAREKPLKAEIFIHLCNCIEATENAAGFL